MSAGALAIGVCMSCFAARATLSITSACSAYMVGQRQRQRIDQQCHPGMGRREARRLALHRPGQANAKWLIESFNGRLRDELLTETLLTSLAQARVALGSWRADYNVNRPHSGLGWQAPVAFAQTFTPRRDTALRSMIGSAPLPDAQPAISTKTSRPSELRTGENLGATSTALTRSHR